MSDQYEIGATIPLRPAVVVDRSGTPITGSTTLTVEIQRDADDYFLDWNDGTFKASGWTTKAGPLTEVSAANAPGWYKRTGGWNSTAQNAGWYWVTYRDTASAAANMPQSEEIRLGGWAGTIATNLDAAITSRASPTNITAGTITTVTNLTNAPTSGDLTATMKASVTTAATAATPTVTVGSLGTDALSAAAVSAAAVAKIATGVIDDATPFHGASIATILSRCDVATSTLATATALATAQGNITTILGYGAPPTASAISTQVNSDLTAAHGAGSYQTASTAGLATATNVSDSTAAVNAHTDGAVAPLALEATLTAIKGASWGASDNLHAIAAFGAPPTVGAISTQVASDLATAHGAGSWATAVLTGIATAQNVTDGVTSTLAGIVSAHGAGSYLTASVAGLATAADVAAGTAAVEAYGDLHWTTATTVGLSPGALTATAIGTGYVVALQSGLASAAALATMQGNVTTIQGYGAPPSAGAIATQVDTTLSGTHGAGSWLTGSAAPTAADNATAVWAKAFGTPDAGTFGWMLYRLGQWGTELCQKRIVGQNLLLQSIGGGTTFATVPLKDVTGGVITPAPGDPAQFLPT